jgi:hypothetical protein
VNSDSADHPQQQQQHLHPPQQQHQAKHGGSSVGMYRVSSSSSNHNHSATSNNTKKTKKGGGIQGAGGQLPPRGLSTSFCPSTLSAMRVRSPTPPGPAPSSSAPAAAKQPQQMVRSALIAELHSARHRNMRVAWYDVFQPQGTRLTAERFHAAVRALPGVPGDVRDRDVEALRGEIVWAAAAGSSGVMSGDDGVVTWAQFARFYQKTREESGGP